MKSRNKQKPENSGFLDQEILVSVFFLDQDVRNSNSNVCVKFVRSDPNIEEVRPKTVGFFFRTEKKPFDHIETPVF